MTLSCRPDRAWITLLIALGAIVGMVWFGIKDLWQGGVEHEEEQS